MSDIVSAPAVVEPEAQSDASNAVDSVNHHTPDPQTPPGVEHVPDKVTPAPEDGKDELRETVATLADSVATLQQVVTGLIDKDERPRSVPWTHYGTRRHD